MSELITPIKLVHGSALDRSSTGVFYVTAGQRVSLPTRKANQKPFEMSNCCLLIEPSVSYSLYFIGKVLFIVKKINAELGSCNHVV